MAVADPAALPGVQTPATRAVAVAVALPARYVVVRREGGKEDAHFYG